MWLFYWQMCCSFTTEKINRSESVYASMGEKTVCSCANFCFPNVCESLTANSSHSILYPFHASNQTRWAAVGKCFGSMIRCWVIGDRKQGTSLKDSEIQQGGASWSIASELTDIFLYLHFYCQGTCSVWPVSLFWKYTFCI